MAGGNDQGGETVSLREHLEALLDERDKRYQQRFELSDKAVASAKAEADKRLDGMNEFRQSLSDQSRLFMPRLEFEKVVDALKSQIGNATSRQDVGEGRQRGLSDSWAVIFAVVAAITAIVAVVIAAVALWR